MTFYIMKYYVTTGKREKKFDNLEKLEEHLKTCPIMAIVSVKQYYGDYEIEDLTQICRTWKNVLHTLGVDTD